MRPDRVTVTGVLSTCCSDRRFRGNGDQAWSELRRHRYAEPATARGPAGRTLRRPFLGARSRLWLCRCVNSSEPADAESTNLRSTRDLLLPKLVSGEIDVSELDIETEWLAS